MLPQCAHISPSAIQCRAWVFMRLSLFEVLGTLNGATWRCPYGKQASFSGKVLTSEDPIIVGFCGSNRLLKDFNHIAASF